MVAKRQKEAEAPSPRQIYQGSYLQSVHATAPQGQEASGGPSTQALSDQLFTVNTKRMPSQRQHQSTPRHVSREASIAPDNSCSPCSLGDAVLLGICRGDPVLMRLNSGTPTECRHLGDGVQQLDVDVMSIQTVEHGRCQCQFNLHSQAIMNCMSALEMRSQE